MLAQPNFALVSGSLLLPIFNSLLVSELNSHPTFIALNEQAIFTVTKDFLFCAFHYIPDLDDEGYDRQTSFKYLLPEAKLYYPEPYIASPSYHHNDLTFLCILQY
jgi:hypothetical protein